MKMKKLSVENPRKETVECKNNLSLNFSKLKLHLLPNGIRCSFLYQLFFCHCQKSRALIKKLDALFLIALLVTMKELKSVF